MSGQMIYISHVFSLHEDKRKSKLRGVIRATMYYNLHMFLSPFRSCPHCFQMYYEYISWFVVGVLGEAKKRKISKRG